jgi:hypothetical protein
MTKSFFQLATVSMLELSLFGPNHGEQVSAHFPCDVSREKHFNAEILEKMVTSMLFRDPYLHPPIPGQQLKVHYNRT